VATALALSTSLAGVAVLYASWRRQGASTTSKHVAVLAGWSLLGLSVVAWVRVGGGEFGTAFAAIAAAFAAWTMVGLFGRERRGSSVRSSQTRVAGGRPGGAATRRTLARACVALPLAGTASLLLSVLAAAGLPWVTADRYVFAIAVAPVLWGVLAMWVGMTEALARAALSLAVVSGTAAALLFVW
jgi:hypothetical protein